MGGREDEGDKWGGGGGGGREDGRRVREIKREGKGVKGGGRNGEGRGERNGDGKGERVGR